MMKKTVLLLTFLVAFIYSNAQTKVTTTAVPFLLVAADARAAGMGDNGVATSADNFSQQWNPAKYAFSTDQQGASLSYTPYLTALVNDISLSQLNYYFKYNDRSAIGASIRYFGLGDIELRPDYDSQPLIVSPNEFALDLSYSLKLSEKFSMAVAGRFINSNLKVPTENNDSSAATSFAVDVAGFYQSDEIAYSSFNGRWRGGFNFQNMGPKMSYDGTEFNSNFLPANLKLGGGFDFILDEYNTIGVNLEFNKLLVPAPEGSSTYEDYQSIGWIQGIPKSFGSMNDLTYSLGAEYVYQDSFSFRGGYFHENPDYGARKFFSLGAGFKYTIVKVDVSYLFSTSKIPNPLENTLRFSLTFNIGDKYENN